MRLNTRFGIVLWFALAVTVFPASTERSQDAVVYQPDFVGEGRIFMVALKVPTGAPDVHVKCPAAVIPLDRTRLPAKSDIRRFYFRARKAAQTAEISVLLARAAGDRSHRHLVVRGPAPVPRIERESGCRAAGLWEPRFPNSRRARRLPEIKKARASAGSRKRISGWHSPMTPSGGCSPTRPFPAGTGST